MCQFRLFYSHVSISKLAACVGETSFQTSLLFLRCGFFQSSLPLCAASVSAVSSSLITQGTRRPTFFKGEVSQPIRIPVSRRSAASSPFSAGVQSDSSIVLIAFFNLQFLQLFHPHCCAGVARHTQITARRYCHASNLRAVRQTGALELLREEPTVECCQPFFYCLFVILFGKCAACHSIYF